MQDSREKAEALKRSLIFSGLEEAELAELARLAILRRLEPGEFAFWEGDSPEGFYTVVEGRIKIVKHSTLGREFIIAFFGPGEMFGEVAVFEGKPYPASAQAVGQALVLGIARREFLAFLSAHPEVALRIVLVLGGRLREAQGRLKDLAGERVEQRLAGILLMLHSKLGPRLPFTRQEVADMAGTTAETAIRFIGRLREGRIVETGRGQITILDERKLKLLAEGPPEI